LRIISLYHVIRRLLFFALSFLCTQHVEVDKTFMGTQRLEVKSYTVEDKIISL